MLQNRFGATEAVAYATLVRLQVKRRIFHAPNTMHKLLLSKYNSFLFENEASHAQCCFCGASAPNEIKMASCLPKISKCQTCFSETKYICITCGVAVCNKCGIAELNENTRGWLVSRSVGYCSRDCEIPPTTNNSYSTETFEFPIKRTMSRLVKIISIFVLHKLYPSPLLLRLWKKERDIC